MLFMTDYSEAKLLAIEKCFPGTEVYLCDFHREQKAWERWTNKHKIRDSKETSFITVAYSCANAPPAVEPTLPSDFNYQQTLKDLKQSDI